MFKGVYKTWEEALGQCTGYDSDEVIEKTRTAALKVKSGAAAFERDTLVYDKIEYSWPLLSVLLKAALDNRNKLHVLDFGGSLGSSYFQHIPMLSDLDELSWNIVEQPRIVEIGRKEIAENRLRFYTTVEECLRENSANLVLLSGVLQCVEKPHDLLQRLIGIGAQYYVLDRTPFFKSDNPDVITIQYASHPYYEASFPSWVFNKKHLFDHFRKNFDLMARYYAFDYVEGLPFTFEGAVIKRAH